MIREFLKPHTTSLRTIVTAIVLAVCFPVAACAHVSEQGFVLLLPTGLYILSGTTAVVVTLLVMTLTPASMITKLFQCNQTRIVFRARFGNLGSLVSTLVLFILILLGLFGPNDPFENLLPLVIWTLWWQGFLITQALFGNLWHWLNPWTGIYCLIKGDLDRPGYLSLPDWLGKLPGILAFFLFMTFSLVDLAPVNPPRLASFTAGYWIYTFFGMIIFGGKNWLERGECFTMLLRLFSLLSIFGIENQKIQFGFPGWRLVNGPTPDFSTGLFAIMILAAGSFDGLNETFWWLAKIGINPLEFPGRSFVVWSSFFGLLSAEIILPVCFALCVLIGLIFIGKSEKLLQPFAIFALSVVPIAVGYHFSHYLTSFMVNIQYVVSSLSDPLANGSDYLNLGQFYVTSGFLNSHDTVKTIWLLQAGFVVAGHVIAVFLSHGFALKMFGKSSQANLVQIPLAIFMISYTVFGLWLLASPRGL